MSRNCPMIVQCLVINKQWTSYGFKISLWEKYCKSFRIKIQNDNEIILLDFNYASLLIIMYLWFAIPQSISRHKKFKVPELSAWKLTFKVCPILGSMWIWWSRNNCALTISEEKRHNLIPSITLTLSFESRDMSF